MGKFDERLFSEQPPPCVLNDSDNDPLLRSCARYMAMQEGPTLRES
jgi:hypothetical protein